MKENVEEFYRGGVLEEKLEYVKFWRGKKSGYDKFSR